MKPITIADRTTIQCAGPTVVTFTQNEEEWPDLKGFQDVGLLLDVFNVTSPGITGPGPAVTLVLKSSPTVDEPLFQPICPPITLTASTSVVATKSIRTPSTQALARWLRYEISVPPGTSGTWGATFQLRAIPIKSRFFVPPDISGCQLWLRADLGVTLDAGGGGGVSTWADQSGNNDVARDLQQANTAKQPTRTLIDSVYNNATTLFFDASGPAHHGMRTGTWTPPDTGSLFIVGNGDGAVGTNRTFFDGTLGAGAYWFECTSATGVRFTRGAALSATVVTTNSPHVYSVEANAASSKIYQDSVTALTTGDPLASAPTSLSVGFDNADANGLNGKIAEIIMYNTVLSDGDRAKVMRYLGARYGVRITQQ